MNITELIANMSYRDLWGIAKARTSYSKSAAAEIRRRRKSGTLPIINSLKTPEIFNDRQNTLYRKLIAYMENIPKVEVAITDSVLDSGWIVYLTGKDDKFLNAKIKMTANMIKNDVEEFGSCRLFIIPITKEYDGLKLCYDRGLRCVFPMEEGPEEEPSYKG
jgi:hypothetical protein